MSNIELQGFKEFENALVKSPEVVKVELQKYFIRALELLKRGVKNNPWRVGGSGGGAPVDTRHLIDDGHLTVIEKFRAFLEVDTNEVKYAVFVHEGTQRMEARPWLDFVTEDQRKGIEELQDDLLKNIVNALAK